MIAYFDTSAIVKLVIDEDESDVASEIWSGAREVVTGELSYPEARAAVAGAHRAGRLDQRAHVAAVRLIDDLIGQVTLARADWEIACAAGDLAASHALRGYDAVHLATALAAGATAMITWDRGLARAAGACGLSVAPA